MSSIFKTVSFKKPRRNAFNLSHDVKLSCKMGQLIPIMCQEALFGDTFKVMADVTCRLAPLVAPMMHNVNIYTHYFFVPYRIIWDDYKDFFTGGENGTKEPVFPYIDSSIMSPGFFRPGTLFDYLQYPSIVGELPVKLGENRFSALPIRAYNYIWNEYYRDQNLSEEIKFSKGSGDSSALLGNQSILSVCWEKDYFTSALPWPQRGGDVTIPGVAGGAAQVRLDPSNQGTQTFLTNAIRDQGDYSLSYSPDGQSSEGSIDATIDGQKNKVMFNPGESLYADLSELTSATINELRRAFALQRYLEINARAGARYVEMVQAHFGVRVPDWTIQRPVFLGGGKVPISVGDVMQTSQTTNDSPQANPAGFGISRSLNGAFRYHFKESGYIIGIMFIRPKAVYQQGCPRHLRKFDRFDYYLPSFAHIGEQTIKNGELYYDLTKSGAENSKDFGYTPRYADYRFNLSRVHGDFKTSLNFWHMARIFSSEPSLNAQFVSVLPSQSGLDRVFAVTDSSVDKFYVDIHFNMKAIRPVSRTGNPI